ncbi:MAG TPA: CopD family protein [Gemmatimonadaceae bacterium]|nr:CopD family protein [Gemmatimonadaceae bacterium]
MSALFSAALYVALVIVIGAVGLRWLLLPRSSITGPARERIERAAAGSAMLATVAVLITVPARVALQLLDFLEPGEPWRPALNAILTATQSGSAALLQMVWATAALLAFSVAKTGRVRGWRAATFAVVVLAMTPGMGGHPAAAEQPVFAMTVATLHVLAAGAWIGTLFHLWKAAHAADEAETRSLVSAFHRVAMSAAGLLLLTGLYAALTMLPTFGDLFTSAWGRLLLAKLALVAAVAGFGAWHWRAAEARIASLGTLSVGRSIGLELSIALGVLLVTGFLAGTSPPS